MDYLQYNTKHTLHKHKTYKDNMKVSLFGIVLVKKQIKLDDAGNGIDRVDMVFQYQIKTIIKQNGQKQSQIKNTIYMYINAY